MGFFNSLAADKDFPGIPGDFRIGIIGRPGLRGATRNKRNYRTGGHYSGYTHENPFFDASDIKKATDAVNRD